MSFYLLFFFLLHLSLAVIKWSGLGGGLFENTKNEKNEKKWKKNGKGERKERIDSQFFILRQFKCMRLSLCTFFPQPLSV